MKTPTFKKGDRVKKGNKYGTVVYDSFTHQNQTYETVKVLWDGKRYDCANWGNIKGIKIVESL